MANGGKYLVVLLCGQLVTLVPHHSHASRTRATVSFEFSGNGVSTTFLPWYRSACAADARFSRPRDGMRRNELSDLAAQIRAGRSHHVTLVLPPSVTSVCAPRCGAMVQTWPLSAQRVQQYKIGIAYFARHIVTDAVEYAELPGFFQCSLLR